MSREVDISRLSRGERERFRDVCAQQDAAALQRALRRQLDLAELNHRRDRAGVDKLAHAQQIACIDPELHNRHRGKYGADTADGDLDFTRWLTKRHPEFAVQARGTRIQSGYSVRSPRSGKRVSFFKVYA